MRIKDGFMLRDVCGDNIVVPVGESSVDFKSVIRLNETGALLWKELEKGADEQQLADAITAEYNVSQEVALNDIAKFVERLKEADILC